MLPPGGCSVSRSSAVAMQLRCDFRLHPPPTGPRGGAGRGVGTATRRRPPGASPQATGGLWGLRGEPQAVLRPLYSQRHSIDWHHESPPTRRKPCPLPPMDFQPHLIVALALGCLYFFYCTCLPSQMKGASRTRRGRFPTRTPQVLAKGLPGGVGTSSRRLHFGS